MLKEQHVENPLAEGGCRVQGTIGQSGEKLREGAGHGAAGDSVLVESLQGVFSLPGTRARPLKDKQGNASRGEVGRGRF